MIYECKRFISVFDGTVVDDHMGLLGSDFIEVDEIIQPIVSLLIYKGFTPRFSCSGHVCDRSNIDKSFDYGKCYIDFKDNIPDLIEDDKFKIPDGFYLEKINNGICNFRIIKRYKSNKDRYIQILDTMRILYDWIISLPNLHHMDIDNEKNKPNVVLAGAKYHIGERVLTIRGEGVIDHISTNNDSILYHVTLGNNKGSYIFMPNQVFDAIKKHIFNINKQES